MATMMATIMATNVIEVDEYTINLSDYYQSTEYLEGLEDLDDYVNNTRYDEEFDLIESSYVQKKEKAKKMKMKAKYAALPLLQQIKHFIKVEKKQCISEKKRMDSMYLHNKRAAKQTDKVKYVNEEVDDIVLEKDSYLERMEREDNELDWDEVYYRSIDIV
jgi:hypothetical protein